MKILAFAASNSIHSINKKFVQYVTGLIPFSDITILDLNDYEMPIYSIDREQNMGIPNQSQMFFKQIGKADAVIISFAEHNGSYTVAYKNLIDWTSRIHQLIFQNKPALYLSASPGIGGAKNVLTIAVNSAASFGAVLKSSFSIPNFFNNFNLEKNILTNPKLEKELKLALSQLLSSTIP
ncbi:hypothetical protein CF66_6041 [Candidatus Photodesmus katoptron]|uniref:NADPH-dependent FMN reductase-like domain-containing protein n=1 Tax=Candidatus Photodesmus katoptron Akat1 TaxID=1236703 RepID=S3DK81_9GAMM|nr:NAD(P)H-dependent oxidoreductase [Candidatus Photodesmus katoptron]EPE37554.1 hypothetical protein O1U_0859 [Candidatus Photodesmus katoptron Akat1]KEY90205.1 hypothetical protein CF66_6041 [Candidatus Photodesmus katoptron]